jgi:hypothetical protein
VEFRLQFDPAEHYRASQAIARLTGDRWWTYSLAFGFPLLLTGWSLGWHLIEGSPLEIDSGAIWPWLFFPLFSFVVIPALTRWQLRRAVRQAPALHGELVRVVTDEGVEARANGVSSAFSWPSIIRAVETREFFVLFYAKKCAYYIPLRAVPVGDLAPLRAVLRTRLGPRVQLIGRPSAPPA